MDNIHKILVANRGEIAVRVIRAAQALGKTAVAVYSDADQEALHVQLADEAIHIGPAPATKSYLDSAKIIAAAQQAGADAIHPGYGFLAENAAFARACQQAQIKFIGPSPEAITQMGDKALARETAQKAGVPVVPGTSGTLASLADAETTAATIGYPLMIKAAAGGGGRGIRIAQDQAELEQLLPQAQREAQASFGDGTVYLERFVQQARHVEVQVLGDGNRAIHLFERECSLQRRRQKVVEETLSPCLTPELRAQMTSAAVRLAEVVAYEGAGTIEFLVDDHTGEFFFIEMNTRIQVEHPITEMICKVDLVQEQIRLADGEPLRWAQEEIRPSGWAIECRINAENPDMNFMPSPGTLGRIQWPQGKHVRIDTAIYEGYTIPPYYDSLIAKLIVWGKTRDEAIRKTRQCLQETQIEGIHTTIPMLRQLMDDNAFIQGAYHTEYLTEWMQKKESLHV